MNNNIYINVLGKIYVDKKKPPTFKDYQDLVAYINANCKIVFVKPKPIPLSKLKQDALRQYLASEIANIKTTVSSFEDFIKRQQGSTEFAETIKSYNDRLKLLIEAQSFLYQKQPPDLIAESLGVHYNESLNTYI